MFNFKAILHIIGILLILNGFFMASILPISWYTNSTDFNALLFSSGISINFGMVIWWLTRKVKKELSKRDGYIIVTLGWLIMGASGSLPFLLSGSIDSMTSAFFETMSGYTTTGASIIENIESLPTGIMLWRSTTQWIGGMGIIVLTVAILPLLGVGGMELFAAESPGPASTKIHSKITDTAKRLWVIYVFITAIEVIFLKFAGMSWLDALNHSFTTISTGGFSTRNASIAAFNSPLIEYIITGFMMIGGINFTIIYFLCKLSFKKAIENEEFRVYLGIIFSFVLLICVTLIMTMDKFTEEAFRLSIFQVTSIVTTTGFATSNYAAWTPFAYMLIVFLMFVGGSAGSTAGGVKVARHLIILKNAYAEFKRLLHPRGIIPVRINNQTVDSKNVYNVLAFFFIYLLTFILGALVISAFGYDIVTSAGASIACLGNIGPGFGGVDPSHSFAFFSDGVQVFLSFLMLLGRLELFTVLILMTPAFWYNV
ncbi:TrkH family potassium uptake protein [Bacteroidia bacterium]|nr:TrkH family potassium uptake protein [Bacteroidia bacterium]MDC0561631.1 TrkH family potassium uptake protein [Bacteroidia bacterium]MDC3406551.1 TrkH family potassium uptake protein [Bacteroidia bacterium]